MRKDTFLKKLGMKVKELRIKKGLTQAELASDVEKDQQSIQRLENGKINPSGYYLHQVAQGLGVPVKTLFDFE